jgi:hypothetical protein
MLRGVYLSKFMLLCFEFWRFVHLLLRNKIIFFASKQKTDNLPTVFTTITFGDTFEQCKDQYGRFQHCEYRCTLCKDVSWDSSQVREAATAHRSDPSHIRNLAKANLTASLFIGRALEGTRLLAEIRGCEGHSDHIRSVLLSYLLAEPTAHDLFQLEDEVEHFKWTMPLLILELKLWKSACVMNPPTPMKDMTNTVVWMTTGWKYNKAAMRRHEMITVVMQGVIPYLDMPSK